MFLRLMAQKRKTRWIHKYIMKWESSTEGKFLDSAEVTEYMFTCVTTPQVLHGEFEAQLGFTIRGC